MPSRQGDPASAIIDTPRVAILGLTPGAGVSTVVLGLLVAYKKAGVAVSACKLGPSLVEATHHRRITGRLSHCLDPWVLSRQQLRATFGRASSGAELMILEGQLQLGIGAGDESPFEQQMAIAQLLKAPVVLVVDGRGYGENLKVVLEELLHRYQGLELAGVIANYVQDQHHARQLRSGVEGVIGLHFLGALQAEPPEQFAGKASIALNRNTSLLTRNQLIRLGNLLESSADLPLIQQLAGKADPVELPAAEVAAHKRRCRIAVADDQAFHLTIQDNLDLIRRAGGELVPFSPLIDHALPSKTAGVYLPSGYLHLYAPDITLNVGMFNSLRRFVEDGGAIYAEGSALAYLCKKITFQDGDTMEMVGVIPGTGLSRHGNGRPPPPVYTQLHTLIDSPLAPAGFTMRGFRNTRWQLRVEGQVHAALEVREQPAADAAERVWREGILAHPNVLATGVHIHFATEPESAAHFIECALRHGR